MRAFGWRVGGGRSVASALAAMVEEHNLGAALIQFGSSVHTRGKARAESPEDLSAVTARGVRVFVEAPTLVALFPSPKNWNANLKSFSSHYRQAVAIGAAGFIVRLGKPQGYGLDAADWREVLDGMLRGLVRPECPILLRAHPEWSEALRLPLALDIVESHKALAGELPPSSSVECILLPQGSLNLTFLPRVLRAYPDAAVLSEHVLPAVAKNIVNMVAADYDALTGA